MKQMDIVPRTSGPDRVLAKPGFLKLPEQRTGTYWALKLLISCKLMVFL